MTTALALVGLIGYGAIARELHRLLAAVSNNVNQMARATNATGEVQAEMSATLDAVRRTAVRIDDAIDGLSLP